MPADFSSLPRQWERARGEIQKQSAAATARVLFWTAQDVRRAARRSILSGGKNPAAKSYKTSKPGEPPRSHRGTLKQAIRYEKDGAGYVVGPEKLQPGAALRALEYGGATSARQSYYSAEYVARVKVQTRRRKKNGINKPRPKAARPYSVATKDRKTAARVSVFRYFYTRNAWQRAAAAPAFQAWGASVRKTETTALVIAARPYMRPALLKEATSEKTAARIARAVGR